jgi:hypothetical protein
MKARDCEFLLIGLVFGAAGCAVVMLSQRLSPAPAIQPVLAAIPAAAPLPASPPPPSEAAFQPGGKIYLAGDVRREGAFDIRPDETVTVSQAIALAGGVAASADARNVTLSRRRADGSSQIIPVDLKLSDSGYVKDPTVEPGDLINVPDKTINR